LLFSAILCVGLERYWYWVIGYWAIFTDIG